MTLTLNSNSSNSILTHSSYLSNEEEELISNLSSYSSI